MRRMLYPEFTYTAEGITYVQQAKTGSTRTKFREGQSVTVHYNPAAPEEWFVGADKNDVIFSCVFMIFGMIIAVCSFVMEVD